jgi:hypothetical protein
MECRAGPLLLAMLLFCGCARSQPESASAPPVKGVDQYASLPGLSSTPHQRLQAERTLLVQERMTPVQLDADAQTARAQRRSLVSRHVPATELLAPAAALHDAFPPISRGLIRGELDAVYAGGPLQLSPVQLQRGRELLVRFAASRGKFRAAASREGEGLGLRFSDGILAELEVLDPLTIGCRLEAVAAADALDDNRPDDAVPAAAIALAAAELLAEEWNVTARVMAANLRSDALEMVRAIATHPLATRQTHERLLDLLLRHTSNWPPDARAWIGDRAAGLIAYELARDGHYLTLLARDEVQRLTDQGILRVTARAVLRNIDNDQLFYLEATRQIIEACHVPYYQRKETLASIRRDLTAREPSADYPLVAGELLLTDFETGHFRQAQDAARCQAWIAALSAALELTPVTITSPVTGEPLQVEIDRQQVRVRGVMAPVDEPIEIPVR